MPDRPFHHGNLRQALLDRAEVVLRERGIDALSLRELARDTGVSHGAPRSHFADRAALLDALAARGFDRLAIEVEAIGRENDDPVEALRALGRGQLEFGLREAALTDLMFAAKGDGPSAGVEAAAGRMFEASSRIIQHSVEAVRGQATDPVDLLRTTLLMASMTQGVAAMVTSRRISRNLGETLLDDALALFLRGELPSAASEGAGSAAP